jgi:osmotically-inducible protein OsmY
MPRQTNETKYPSTELFHEEFRMREPSDYSAEHLDWDETDKTAEAEELEKGEDTVRSDEQIEASVKGALSSEPNLNASQIEVQVIKGVVLLTGNVTDGKMKTVAEKRLGNIPGVREVKNQLHLHLR